MAIIPHLVVGGALVRKDYALLVTDQRMIFILQIASHARLGALLGGAVGAVIVTALTEPRSVDYAAPPEEIARLPDSIVLPYGSVEAIQVKRGPLGKSYSLIVSHLDEQRRKRRLVASLVPAEYRVAEGRRAGLGRREILQRCIAEVIQALETGLPPGLRLHKSWED